MFVLNIFYFGVELKLFRSQQISIKGQHLIQIDFVKFRVYPCQKLNVSRFLHMKKYIFFLFISLFPAILFAQMGYYAIDTTNFSGIKLKDEGNLNFKFCQVKKGNQIIRFSPNDIESYGFNDRRFYKAFTIDVNDRQERYFLQSLVTGKVNLYYAVIEGEKKYFLTDSIRPNPIEIPQLLNNNKLFVDSMLDYCPQAITNIPYVRTRRNDLMRYIKDYNSCANRPFLRTRFGFEIGATSYNLSAVNYTWLYPIPGNMNFIGFAFGAFADIPFSAINLSIHPELNFEYFKDSKAFFHDYDYDLVLNSSSVTIPVYLRYTVMKKSLSPFFQVGPVYSRSIHKNSTLYQYDTVGDEIFTSVIDSRVLQNDMAGYSFGTGVISNYGSKYSWFAEADFNKIHNLKKNTNLYNRYEIALKIGILF